MVPIDKHGVTWQLVAAGVVNGIMALCKHLTRLVRRVIKFVIQAADKEPTRSLEDNSPAERKVGVAAQYRLRVRWVRIKHGK